LIDGDAVACDERGLAVFHVLGRRQKEAQAFLYPFDLLLVAFAFSIPCSGSPAFPLGTQPDPQARAGASLRPRPVCARLAAPSRLPPRRRRDLAGERAPEDSHEVPVVREVET
jgi:hypothetical protein